MKSRRLQGILIFVFFLLFSCAQNSADSSLEGEKRPAHWAQKVKGTSGLPNLYKINDALYRGGQPEKEGFAQLKAMGIKTVVNLRSLHSDRKECEKYGLGYVKITTQAWEAEEEEVLDFLKVVSDPKRHPVYVHCKHGADRTGMMCAVYRVVVQGWTKEEAIREMTKGGYGFHTIWKNLVAYIRKFDAEKIKKKLKKKEKDGKKS